MIEYLFCLDKNIALQWHQIRDYKGPVKYYSTKL